MVNAAFEAFKIMESPRSVANRRGKKVSDIVSNRDVALKGKAAEATEADAAAEE